MVFYINYTVQISAVKSSVACASNLELSIQELQHITLRVNGQVECFNHTLESMLAKVVTDDQKDWDKHLPPTLFAYCTSLHDTTISFHPSS